MIERCPNCRWTIAELNLTSAQRQNLLTLLQQEQKMRAIQYLNEVTTIGLTAAKGTIMHLHAEHGHCVNCSYSELQGERCLCPQCGSFNFNLSPEAPND